LHWFGQTIGEGRGLEDAVKALAYISEPIELHLRGRLAAKYRSSLEELSNRHNVTAKIFFHPPVPPEELVETMGQFDVGLALERPEHGNYSLAATNKLLNYLLAGLAVAATDTPGHRELLNHNASIGFLYPAGSPQVLAEGLRKWILDRAALRRAQQTSWEAARQKFCWDIEKEKFLSALQPPLSVAAFAQ
jgi:glycosyltransferase involved in cell wall biosynthesis